jgi:hypothetical protein
MSRSFAAILIPKFVEAIKPKILNAARGLYRLRCPGISGTYRKIPKDFVNSVDLRCESIILVIPRDKRTGLMCGAGVLPGSGSSRSWSD